MSLARPQMNLHNRLVRFMTMRSISLSALLVLAVLSACDDPSAPPEPHARVLAVTIDSSMGPTFRWATVILDRPSGIELTYGAEGTRVLTLPLNDTVQLHRVMLPRLRASREYVLEAAVIGSTGDATTLTFGTGPLPEDVAAMTFEESGTPTMPLTLIEIAGSTAFYGMLMVEDGEVVGYLPSSGSLFGATRRDNGNIVMLDGSLGLVERQLDGRIVHRLPQPDSSPGAPYGRIHHDVTTTPTNSLLFIANETRAVDGETVVGEALWEWVPETNAVTRRWSAFDHLDWQTDRGLRSVAGNWLHGNGLSYGPRGNVVMSLRNADIVISIASDFSRLEWQLGGGGETLSLVDSHRFFGQHYVSAPAANRLLVYDNGFERPGGPFTRAVEYAIDVPKGRATKVWEYRTSPDIYAALVGSARRLPNGNTVINFGMSPGHSGSSGPLAVMEVDAAGVERWRLTPGPALTRLYRATPVASLMGEQEGQFSSHLVDQYPHQQ